MFGTQFFLSPSSCQTCLLTSTSHTHSTACNKCRVRKAKCSCERPMCERCRIRGLVCQYPIEGRAHRGGPSSRIGHAVHSKNDQRIQGMCLRHPSSTEVFDVLRDPEPRKAHIVVHEAEHGAFEPTKYSITSEGGERKGTLNEGDLPTFVVPRLLEGAAARCHKDVDGAWQPMSSCHPCNLHRTASYDRSVYCASNPGSPVWTPSPTTPIDNYPSSLASLASLSPLLGPYASGIPPESHFDGDIQMMGMDSPWDMELFLDLDVVC
ncbi:hypothetical protein EV363DRAFT_1326264 [Boletus edulis]|nr:hypothetical protein EV363DRAFT_1326264 [Boletus edulis]